MNKVYKYLKEINQHLLVIIPGAMLIGFLYGAFFLAAPLKPYILPFTFLMIYPMMTTLNVDKIFNGGDLKLQLITHLINFCIIPFVTFVIGFLFFKNDIYMMLGLLLLGLLPSSGMSISWVGFAKGNVESAVKIMVSSLIIGTFLAPLYIEFLVGESITIDMLAIVKQMVFIVFIPMAIGFITRKVCVHKLGEAKFKEKIASKLSPVSTFGAVGIVFIAMALKSQDIINNPSVLLSLLLPVSLMYLVGFIIATFLGRLIFNYKDAVVLVYSSALRNLTISLAIAMNLFGAEGSNAALVITVAFIVQVQLSAWFLKFANRFLRA